MARVARASAALLLALLALACCARGTGAWPGSKKSALSAPAPAQDDAAAPAATPDVKSHVDETGINTYWYNEVNGEVSAKDPTVAVRGFTSKSGHTYWVDPETGEATWERPAAYSWKEQPSAEHAGHTFFYNLVTRESTWVRPAVLGWKAAEKGFWHNNVTGESTWRQPDALGVSTPDGSSRYWVVDGQPSWQPPAQYAWRAVPSSNPAHNGRMYFENWVTKEASWERPAALGWSRRSYNSTFWFNVVSGETQRQPPSHVVGFEAPSGHKYYVDPTTKQPTWDAPAAAAWKEAHSEEHDRPYYFNRVTRESSWERPADSNVAWVRFHEEL